MPLNKYFVIIGLLMCLVKPFAGFSLCNRISTASDLSILVKSFTQRKQEYAENSEYDVAFIQKQLADADILLLAFFSIFNFLPIIFSFGKIITNRIISEIHSNLFPPQPLYLLAGRLSI
jgi:hypothetical protein